MRKTVTVVFSDVTGSTALGERLDPESLRQVMGRYFDSVRRVLTGHGGTVEKFIGDAVMAVFGVPAMHEDDALRAVRAAWDIRHALEDLNEELEALWGVRLQVRTGVNTGEVVAGSGAHGSAVVTGDSVNVAARLEQAADPGEILLGATTHDLVRDAVRVEPLSPLSVRGKQAPVAAVRLLDVVPGVLGRARRSDMPLVGREQELALLDLSYRRTVRDRTCQLVTVLGDAGVGKSRLVAEAVAAVSTQATVVRGECLPYGSPAPLWPAASVVRGVAGIAVTDELTDPVARLSAALPGELALPVIERLAQLLGAGNAGSSASVDDLAWGVRKLFEALGRRGSLVVVFEDLHWAEPTFLDLIDHLVDWSRDAPILLVCTGRPELLDRRPAWAGGKRNAITLHLEPLSGPESEELLSHLLGPAPVPEPTLAHIAAAAEGNPLFVEELVSKLIEDGLLRGDSQGWEATEDLSAARIPASIQLILAARLDHLGPEGLVLQRASVEGRMFDRGAVVALSPPEERPPVAGSLRSLSGRDLIRPQESGLVTTDGFEFRHALIRDAAYDSLPKQERALLHERLAGWFEQMAAERTTEYDELIAHHLETAYRYRLTLGRPDAKGHALAGEAGRRLRMAGRRALDREDMTAATEMLSRAVGLVDPADGKRAELLHDLGTALMGTGRLAEAHTTLSEARQAAVASEDERVAAHVLVTSIRLTLQTDAEAVVDTVDQELERVILLFESLGDERGLARTWRLRASLHWHRSQTGASAEALTRALEHARAAADEQEELRILGDLTGVALLGPTPVSEGIERCEEALAKAAGRPSLEGRALRALGGMRGMQGEFDEARGLLARSVTLLSDLGIAGSLGGALLAQGGLEMLAGVPGAAEGPYRRCYELFRQAGDKDYLATAAAFLAGCLAAMGRQDEAEELVTVSRQNAAEDDIETQMQWRAAQAMVLAGKGQLAEAEALGRQAVELGRQTDLHASADLLVGLGETLAARGRFEEAAGLADEALEAYARKGDVAARARAIDLLDVARHHPGSTP
jgi:class 3 adenylate cyclase/tetratricopeptide (TPR) repeat protein